MLSELRLAVGCFVAFHLVPVLLNILQREHRLDTLRRASSVFPWAAWQSAQIQFAFFLPGAQGAGCQQREQSWGCIKEEALYAQGTVYNWAELCVSCFLLCGIWSAAEIRSWWRCPLKLVLLLFQGKPALLIHVVFRSCPARICLTVILFFVFPSSNASPFIRHLPCQSFLQKETFLAFLVVSA